MWSYFGFILVATWCQELNPWWHIVRHLLYRWVNSSVLSFCHINSLKFSVYTVHVSITYSTSQFTVATIWEFIAQIREERPPGIFKTGYPPELLCTHSVSEHSRFQGLDVTWGTRYLSLGIQTSLALPWRGHIKLFKGLGNGVLCWAQMLQCVRTWVQGPGLQL